MVVWCPAVPVSKFAANARKKLIKPKWRTFEVRRCSFVQISSIDVEKDTFTGQLYVELWVAGGGNDPEFARLGSDFPVDEAGKPTFRPPIRWYAQQLDFNNAMSFSVMGEPTVKTEGDDICVALRFEGTWFSGMDLTYFPFDAQQLKASLAMNTRTKGMVPALSNTPYTG